MSNVTDWVYDYGQPLVLGNYLFIEAAASFVTAALCIFFIAAHLLLATLTRPNSEMTQILLSFPPELIYRDEEDQANRMPGLLLWQHNHQQMHAEFDAWDRQQVLPSLDLNALKVYAHSCGVAIALVSIVSYYGSGRLLLAQVAHGGARLWFWIAGLIIGICSTFGVERLFTVLIQASSRRLQINASLKRARYCRWVVVAAGAIYISWSLFAPAVDRTVFYGIILVATLLMSAAPISPNLYLVLLGISVFPLVTSLAVCTHPRYLRIVSNVSEPILPAASGTLPSSGTSEPHINKPEL